MGLFYSHLQEIQNWSLSESNVVRTFELFDHSVLLKMKLLNFPSCQDSSSSQAPLYSQAPPKKSHPSQSCTQYFDFAYYNTLTAQVLNITTGQERLFDQQANIIKTEEEIMQHLHSLSTKVDTMHEDQQTLMMMFKNQFPSPSGSNERSYWILSVLVHLVCV